MFIALKARHPANASYSFIALQMLAGFWMLVVGGAAALLLTVADTWLGRAFAMAAMLAAMLPWAISAAWARRSTGWNRGVAVLAGGFGALLLAVGVTAMRVKSPSIRSRVTEQFTAEPSGWLRYSPGRFVPEGDQLLFGFTLMAAIDPILTREKAAELKRMTAGLYREQAGDPDFAGLGSAMPDAYAELFGFRPDSGHAYVYVPRTIRAGASSPLLVFFHGSGGNFKAYLWVLAALAERLGFVLVAPSSGVGEWREEQSLAALESALAVADRVARIDRGQVHLIGLSNGGRAVSQLAAARGRRFRMLVFLSPVFDGDAISSIAFGAQCRDRPVLVLTGVRDDRTPLRYVEANLREMRRNGAKVELQTLPDADHFMMFSHRGALLEILTERLAHARQD